MSRSYQQQEILALRAAGCEDRIDQVSMTNKLVFKHFNGDLWLTFRDFSDPAGPEYTPLKRFNLASAWEFHQKHPIVTFLFQSVAFEAADAYNREYYQ